MIPTAEYVKYGNQIFDVQTGRCANLDYQGNDATPVKHGKWESPFINGMSVKLSGMGVICSECQLWSDNQFNYCPNCGAKMDGERKDGER